MTLLFELDVQLLLILMDLFSIVDIIVACRFTNAVDPNGFTYDYNPCSTFSDTAACTDVYVSINHGIIYSIIADILSES